MEAVRFRCALSITIITIWTTTRISLSKKPTSAGSCRTARRTSCGSSSEAMFCTVRTKAIDLCLCEKSAAMGNSSDSLLQGATRATGTVAVIDVFRAFTTAAVALANGATSIVMVRTVEEALALREAGISEICMGEVGGKAPDGFDFGNSPFEI